MNPKLEALKKSLHDLKERAGKSKPEEIQQLIKSAVEQSRGVGRAGEFFVGKDDNEIGAGGMDQLHLVKSADPKVIEFQKQADELYLLSKILNVDPRSTRMFQKFRKSELAKAMDTATTNEGTEWVPTQFSADLIDKVRLELKVAALHAAIPMPTNPYKLPIVYSDAVAYLVAEATGDYAGTTLVTPSTPGSTNTTLTAKKLGARVDFSDELSEDSIIPVLPFVRNNVAVALAGAVEDATINGDDTGAGHQDSDVTAATDRRKAWKGYRKLAQVSQNLSTFSLANLRLLRAAMGKYGVDPAQLAWIVGIKGFNKFLDLTEVRTVDQYGPEATVLKGELAKLDAIPVIISEKQRENLNATGVYDGTTTDKTVLQLVHKASLVYGDRKLVTTETDRVITTGQTILVSTLRKAFDIVRPSTDAFVGLGYNF